MKLYSISAFFLVVLLLQGCVAPPVKENKENSQADEEAIGGLEDYMEYHRYLKEVVNALESDPDFRAKLEKAEEHDIKSGKIAEELEFVSHHVRTRLDEIKRVELDRLRDLTEKKRALTDPSNDLEDPNHGHLDHANPHTFEIEDLKKLISKTTEDLAEADRKRREEFKQYEMQKEYDKQIKINNTTDSDQRTKMEKEFQEREEKHKKHEKLHEPGHKAQLQEVWEEQDQMQQEFDPKTFFMLHDIDSNGLWDQDEVKALFIKELEKMYQQGAPEDDMRERAEEMERMRESVFKEVDLNKDGFIDYQEFLAQTKRNDFNADHGWQGLDENKPYTDEELNAYIQQRNRHQGYPQQYYPNPDYPGHAGYPQAPPQGYHPNAGPQYHPGQGHLNSNEMYPQHPGGYPPQYQQHPQQGYQHPQQDYQQHPQQGYQQHPPQGYQQHPQQGYQQHPQQGYQQQQHPQQGYQQQHPQQQGYHQPQGQGINQQAVPNQQQVPSQKQVPAQPQQVPAQQQQEPVQKQQPLPQQPQVPPQQVPVQQQAAPAQQQPVPPPQVPVPQVPVQQPVQSNVVNKNGSPQVNQI